MYTMSKKSQSNKAKTEEQAVANTVEMPRTDTELVTPTVSASPEKKRIRIRKKATKKLSAAIICKDPTIQRFI